MAAAKKQTKKDLEDKIAELEAKLNQLSDQLTAKPEETKPAEVKPAEVKPAEQLNQNLRFQKVLHQNQKKHQKRFQNQLKQHLLQQLYKMH